MERFANTLFPNPLCLCLTGLGFFSSSSSSLIATIAAAAAAHCFFGGLFKVTVDVGMVEKRSVGSPYSVSLEVRGGEGTGEGF